MTQQIISNISDLEMAKPRFAVSDLCISFDGKTNIVDQVNFSLNKGEIFGIVGESGSGKSLTCRAIMGLLPNKATASGSLHIDGQDYELSNQAQLHKIRGSICSMIFQDPMSALNPLMTVEKHLKLHLSINNQQSSRNACIHLLKTAGMSNPKQYLDAYPHQLSGGQCQRVAIALAMAGKPDILIADEPTTALDVILQAEILDKLTQIAKNTGMSVILISHDIGVISQYCSRVAVMYKGKIVEQGDVDTVFNHAQHSYTQELIASLSLSTLTHLGRCDGAPVLNYQSVNVSYTRPDGSIVKAMQNVSVNLHKGEILGIVGESGSGKTTFAKIAVGLVKPSSGGIQFEDKPLSFSGQRGKKLRQRIQYVLQDSLGSLDPRIDVLSQVIEPLTIHNVGAPNQRRDKAIKLLERMGITASLFSRYPRSLSGGQRQRISLARSLILQPEILICDESVSALDVAVQAQTLNLLVELQRELNLSILFISHDLSVIRHISDRVVVMRFGEIVELADTHSLFNTPKHEYTKSLIASLPEFNRPTEPTTPFDTPDLMVGE
ncbi:MAG: glutathione ABC transporter ATP-binding protein [Hyphomicrobiales bacterium]|nr:MAG: glutathione ABC transporter ATP-binding protein [Hyphomicrobiales bacterium]